MAARRRRKRRRRGRFSFLYKLLSVLLILCAVVGGSIVFFRVEEITVTGNTVYSEEEIIAAAGVEAGDNLFLVGRMKTSQRILEQLPYINNVNVRPFLPSTLAITVTECVPACVIEAEDGSLWVSDIRGKLLEQGGTALQAQFPLVTGLTALAPQEGRMLQVPEEQAERLEQMKNLLSALESREMLEAVDYIDITGLSELILGYEGRFTVKVPMYKNFLETMNQLKAAVEQSLNDGQTGVIDLTLQRPRFIPN